MNCLYRLNSDRQAWTRHSPQGRLGGSAQSVRGIADPPPQLMVSVVDSRFRGNDRVLDSTFMGITKREATVRSIQRLVKTGGRLIKHARYYWLLLAQGHLTRRLFSAMLRRIDLLPLPAG